MTGVEARCFYENPPEATPLFKMQTSLDEKTAIELEKRKREFISRVITPEIIENMIEEKLGCY